MSLTENDLSKALARMDACREGCDAGDPFYADVIAWDRLRPIIARHMYAHAPPAAPVESPCTCPSGDGSLRWPCPQHPPTESIGRAPDGLCPQCNGEKEGYLIDGDGPYLCNACEDAPPAVPVASVPDGYQLSASEARVLIDQHEWWIAEAESIGAEHSGNERKLERLRAIATNQEGAAP